MQQSQRVQAPGRPGIDAARRTIADCERRLTRYRAALEAGANAATVAGWICQAAAAKTEELLRHEPPVHRRQRAAADVEGTTARLRQDRVDTCGRHWTVPDLVGPGKWTPPDTSLWAMNVARTQTDQAARRSPRPGAALPLPRAAEAPRPAESGTVAGKAVLTP